MGQAKQRGTYEQRKALAIALIEENTKVATIETKKLQAETGPRIMMVGGGSSSMLTMAIASALVAPPPIILNVRPNIPSYSRTRKHKGL